MITQNKKKYIKSLAIKKYQKQYGLFVVEGKKCVDELIKSDYEIEELYIKEKSNIDISEIKTPIYYISDVQMNSVSNLSSSADILAVVKAKELPFVFKKGLTLMFEDIQNPGNLGTIIRTANWFGVSNLICSLNTVDKYNPKLIQASMGALFNTSVYYTNLSSFLEKHSFSNVYGAFINGKSVFKTKLLKDSCIVFGNESKGISQNLSKYLENRITVPKFGTIESLSVSNAVSVFCALYRMNFS